LYKGKNNALYKGENNVARLPETGAPDRCAGKGVSVTGAGKGVSVTSAGSRCASVLFQHFPSLGTAYLFCKFVMSRFGKAFGEQVGKVTVGRYVHQVKGAGFE
jgi:hypothetical protein